MEYIALSPLEVRGKVKCQLFHMTTAVIDSNKKQILNLPLISKMYF